MIKATKNGDFSTKNVVDEYSRLIDNYSGRFVDEYSGSNLQIYNMYDKLWGPSHPSIHPLLARGKRLQELQSCIGLFEN